MCEAWTQYLPELNEAECGDWVIDTQNDGPPEHPKHFPVINYDTIIDKIWHAIYAFEKSYPDYQLAKYDGILAKSDIVWKIYERLKLRYSQTMKLLLNDEILWPRKFHRYFVSKLTVLWTTHVWAAHVGAVPCMPRCHHMTCWFSMNDWFSMLLILYDCAALAAQAPGLWR